jgi:hypothetical protein
MLCYVMLLLSCGSTMSHYIVNQAISLGCFRFCSQMLRRPSVYSQIYYIILVPDMEVQGQLACPRSSRSTSRKVVNCICVRLYILYCVPMMLTCIKSVKIPSCKGRVVCMKSESLGQTTCCWVGQNKYNRLKINHDTHEFILEFGTVANNTA